MTSDFVLTNDGRKLTLERIQVSALSRIHMTPYLGSEISSFGANQPRLISLLDLAMICCCGSKRIPLSAPAKSGVGGGARKSKRKFEDKLE